MQVERYSERGRQASVTGQKGPPLRSPGVGVSKVSSPSDALLVHGARTLVAMTRTCFQNAVCQGHCLFILHC